MAWKAEHQRSADRREPRYAPGLTDDEWALLVPLVQPAKRGGRRREVDVREVLKAPFHVLSSIGQ
jgi:transposase